MRSDSARIAGRDIRTLTGAINQRNQIHCKEVPICGFRYPLLVAGCCHQPRHTALVTHAALEIRTPLQVTSNFDVDFCLRTPLLRPPEIRSSRLFVPSTGTLDWYIILFDNGAPHVQGPVGSDRYVTDCEYQ